MKKIIFIICVAVIALLLAILFSPREEPIGNVIVNPENGDFAIAYRDYENGNGALLVTVYNKDGETLYSKSWLDGNYPHMTFHGEELCIVRDDEIFSYDRKGNPINSNVAKEQIEQNDFFEGWSYSSGMREYTFGKYIYRYKEPTLFSRNAYFEIIKGSKTRVIYESE